MKKNIILGLLLVILLPCFSFFPSCNLKYHFKSAKIRLHISRASSPTLIIPNRETTSNQKRKVEQSQFVQGAINKPLVKRNFIIRKPMKYYSIGQKVNATIISKTHYGLYVDIGTTKDGLIHVEDMSQSYYTHFKQIENNFYEGQIIQAWIKFIDPNKGKFRLQLYPFDPESHLDFSQKKLRIRFKNMQIGQEVEGKVVKVANNAVYVDIGSSMLAMIHRRKIRSNNRQRKLLAWELLPFNSTISAYIYNFNATQRVLELTTYPPDTWERVFANQDALPKINRKELFQNHESILQFIENKKNRRKIEIPDEIEEDEDSDFDSFEEDDGTIIKEEIFSSEELEKYSKKLLLLDDNPVESFSNSNKTKSFQTDSQSKKDRLTSIQLDSNNLFSYLAGQKGYITLSDIRSWSNYKLLKSMKNFTDEQLKEIFVSSGAVSGKLREEKFERFLKSFDTIYSNMNENNSLKNIENEELEVDGQINPKAIQFLNF